MKKLVIILFVFINIPGFTQSTYQVLSDSEVIVKGTSTLHDWVMETRKVKGDGTFIINGSNIKEINDLSISMAAEDLKSGKSGMDKKAYTALNTEEHKTIRFNLKNVESITFSNGVNEIVGTGDLEINNVVKTIPVIVGCKVLADKIICEGKNTMQMTGFEVEPPTAMLGSIKTGDQITIDFNLSFVK